MRIDVGEDENDIDDRNYVNIVLETEQIMSQVLFRY